jgi:hypothetical protein
MTERPPEQSRSYTYIQGIRYPLPLQDFYEPEASYINWHGIWSTIVRGIGDWYNNLKRLRQPPPVDTSRGDNRDE